MDLVGAGLSCGHGLSSFSQVLKALFFFLAKILGVFVVVIGLIWMVIR